MTYIQQTSVRTLVSLGAKLTSTESLLYVENVTQNPRDPVRKTLKITKNSSYFFQAYPYAYGPTPKAQNCRTVRPYTTAQDM